MSALGAGAGTLVGALAHRTTVVFPGAEAPRTSVAVLIVPRAIGGRISRQ